MSYLFVQRWSKLMNNVILCSNSWLAELESPLSRLPAHTNLHWPLVLTVMPSLPLHLNLPNTVRTPSVLSRTPSLTSFVSHCIQLTPSSQNNLRLDISFVSEVLTNVQVLLLTQICMETMWCIEQVWKTPIICYAYMCMYNICKTVLQSKPWPTCSHTLWTSCSTDPRLSQRPSLTQEPLKLPPTYSRALNINDYCINSTQNTPTKTIKGLYYTVTSHSYSS